MKRIIINLRDWLVRTMGIKEQKPISVRMINAELTNSIIADYIDNECEHITGITDIVICAPDTKIVSSLNSYLTCAQTEGYTQTILLFTSGKVIVSICCIICTNFDEKLQTMFDANDGVIRIKK